MKPDNITNRPKISIKEAMSMNRVQRRRLGKINGIKIPGTSVSAVNPERREKKALQKAWWQSKK